MTVPMGNASDLTNPFQAGILEYLCSSRKQWLRVKGHKFHLAVVYSQFEGVFAAVLLKVPLE